MRYGGVLATFTVDGPAHITATVPDTAVSGKITTKVEDKTTVGEPKDVVKLSKGEPAGAAAGTGKPRSNAERYLMKLG